MINRSVVGIAVPDKLIEEKNTKGVLSSAPLCLLRLVALANSDHLSNVNQVGIFDVRVEHQQTINCRSKFVGDNSKRITSLDRIGRNTCRDRDGLPNVDQIWVGDLRIDLEDRIYSGIEPCSDPAQCVTTLGIIKLSIRRRRICWRRWHWNATPGGHNQTLTFVDQVDIGNAFVQ